jgi:magnesium chelatase subunit I
MLERPNTLGELIEAGYRPRSVREEIRENLVAALREGRNPFPGILGYDRTVLPALHNAILAHHDMVLLGLRGQAKTRILRALVGLLDEAVPVIVGSELNESPFSPFSKYARRLAASAGADLPVEWLPREARYREKLATPDVTIADLIGDIDPVKAATLKKTFADEEVIHYGIVPRTNRGIFAINELPDLQPRIQVGLLNILEERDLQIRGFPIRIPLDILMVFSANPEDYTNRGNIITPLKDRIASQILTHYPQSVKTAVAITDQEAWTDRKLSGVTVQIPDDVKLLLEEIAFVARRSDLVDQSSGVSARMPIAARELLVSNLERRALRCGESVESPRLVDLFATLPAITGKVEMVFEGEQQGPELVAKKLVGEAVKALFDAKFPPVDGPKGRAEKSRPRRAEAESEAGEARGPFAAEKGSDKGGRAAGNGHTPAGPYDRILASFQDGKSVVLSDDTPFAKHLATLESIDGLSELVLARAKPADPHERAFLMELVLEGLVQSLRIAREDLDSTVTYAEMAKFNLMRSRG